MPLPAKADLGKRQSRQRSPGCSRDVATTSARWTTIRTPNLAVALGFNPEQLAKLQRVPRDEILEERTDPDGQRALHLTRPFSDVLTEYGAAGPDNVGVLVMTGLIGVGKG